MSALGRRRFVAFAVSAFLLSILAMTAILVMADLVLHRRAERSAGLNHRGYRGPVVGRKRAGEVRVVVLGGSTVFGYGNPWDEAFPALLERMLNTSDARRPWTVVNLGFNAEGVHALLPTLDDFADLNFDVACFYVGYNDMLGDGGPNLALMRRESALFRRTGYFPILPAFLKEKALALRYGGDLEAAYVAMQPGEQPRTVFRPTVAARVSATALETASSISDSLSRQLAVGSPARPVGEAAGDAGCSHPWMHFCDSIYRAARHGLSRGIRVIVASQPRMTDPRAHDRQRQALAAMMGRQFHDEPRVRYLDLGSAVDLTDRNYSFDTMHLGLDGNRVIAAAFLDPVKEMAAVPALR